MELSPEDIRETSDIYHFFDIYFMPGNFKSEKHSKYKMAQRHPSHERMLLHPSTYCHSRSDSMAKAASKMRNMVKSLSMSNVSNLTNSRNWDLKICWLSEG